MDTVTLSLPAADKLTDENYARWKNNTNTILIINDFRFVLTKEHPSIPPSTAAQNVRKAYERWTRTNEKAQAYILASLNEFLAKKHKPMITSREIIESLREIFEQPSMQLRHNALKYIFNSRMTEGTSVREHVLNMMVYFNVTEMNRSNIDEASQVSIILESLPENFLHFVSHAVLNRVDYNITTLLNEL
ncbi:uncharacterized protein LOC120084715 [Benincasa hispida]|uniref:uncharacterized protein LOC120084715 n=1 Tax=Benincasa hispida TaxID=102211 RepID=UPI00190148F0|nr:uncharacterized protein LOC120084715 [Benincasa hispida]